MEKKFKRNGFAFPKIFFATRGFIITVDSFIGGTLLFFFVIISFFYLSKTTFSSWDFVDLKIMVFDQLSVLEKNLVLENSIEQGSSELLLSAINATPNNYCFEIVVFDSNLAPVLHALKGGCVKDSSEVIGLDRTVVVNNSPALSFYVARIEGWLK